MMYCSKCGSDLRGSRSRCPTCGYSVDQMRLEDGQRKVGYKHSEIKKETPPMNIKRDKYGDIIPGYTPEGRKLREDEEKPRVLTFRKPLDEEGS